MPKYNLPISASVLGYFHELFRLQIAKTTCSEKLANVAKSVATFWPNVIWWIVIWPIVAASRKALKRIKKRFNSTKFQVWNILPTLNDYLRGRGSSKGRLRLRQQKAEFAQKIERSEDFQSGNGHRLQPTRTSICIEGEKTNIFSIIFRARNKRRRSIISLLLLLPFMNKFLA